MFNVYALEGAYYRVTDSADNIVYEGHFYEVLEIIAMWVSIAKESGL